MSKNSSMTHFVAGVLVGTAIGILYAPKKGSETREDLKNAFDNLVQKVKNLDAQDVKDAVSNKIADIKKSLSELDKEKVAEFAKAKAALIKEKCEDLVTYCKDKGIPAVEKAAVDLKDKTVTTTKKIVKKIEDKKNSKKEVKVEEA